MILEAIPLRKPKFAQPRSDRPEPRSFGEIAAGLVARLAERAGPILH